jgi:hypothetical protein
LSLGLIRDHGTLGKSLKIATGKASKGVMGRMLEKTTISVIKSDVGSLVGHHIVPKPLLDIGKKRLKVAKDEGLINSYYVFNAGEMTLNCSWFTQREKAIPRFTN